MTMLDTLNNKQKVFLAIALFWIVALGGFIGMKEFTLRSGTEVLLQIVPVDPRDLFRGDYVILRYDITTITSNDISSKVANYSVNDTVYTRLAVDENKLATLLDVVPNKPDSGLFIKGNIARANSNRLTVEYGIESYFVPENTGREIERNLRDSHVRVVIDAYGTAVIKGIVIDGKDHVFNK